MKDQSSAVTEIAGAMTRAGRKPAPPIGVLQEVYALDSLPKDVGGHPSSESRSAISSPMGFDPNRGRSSSRARPAAGDPSPSRRLLTSVLRADPKAEAYYLGNARSSLATAKIFKVAETSIEKVEALARKLTP